MLFYYLSLVLIPFDNHPILSYSYHGITPIKVVGGIAFLAALFRLAGAANGRPAEASPLKRYFLFFVVIFTVSFVLNADYHEFVVFRFISVCMIFVTTVVLVDSRERFIISLALIMVSMGIASLYMFREFSLYGGIYANYRPSGILNDPNYSALSILTALPLAFFLLRAATERRYKLVLLCLLLLYLGAILISQSRGGLIGLAVVLLLILREVKPRKKELLVWGVAIAIIIALLPVDFTRRFREEDTGTQVSTEVRYALLKSGIEMIKNNPVIGVGPGSFKRFSTTYYDELTVSQMAHNSYIELAAELGVGGLLLFLLIGWKSIRQCSLFARQEENDAVLRASFTGLKFGLVGYYVAALFLSAYHENTVWLLVALVAAAQKVAGLSLDGAEQYTAQEASEYCSAG